MRVGREQRKEATNIQNKTGRKLKAGTRIILNTFKKREKQGFMTETWDIYKNTTLGKRQKWSWSASAVLA